MTGCQQIRKLPSLVASGLIFLTLWPSYYHPLHLSFLTCAMRKLSSFHAVFFEALESTACSLGTGVGEWRARGLGFLIPRSTSKGPLTLFYIFGVCARLGYWSAHDHSFLPPLGVDVTPLSCWLWPWPYD